MEWISPEKKTQIAAQFAKLGYTDFPGGLLTAEEAIDSRDATIKAVSWLEYPVLSHYQADVFIYLKEQSDASWMVGTIRGSVPIPSESSDEGVIYVTKDYHSKDGALPSKEQLIQQLSFLVQIEENNELNYIRGALDESFKRLDFGGFITRIVRDGDPWEKRYYTELTEKIGSGGDQMNFRFNIMSADADDPIRIVSIKGSLFPEGVNVKEGFPAGERTFILENGPLPTKREIIRQVLSGEKLKGDVYDEIRKRFQIGETREVPKQAGAIRQGHLGL